VNLNALDLSELEEKTVQELQDMGRELGLSGVTSLKKQELVFKILQTQTEQSGLIFREGILEILPDGFGFLRSENLQPNPEDVYVSQSQIKRFGLKTGDMVSGQVRPPKDNERYFSLLRIEALNGGPPEAGRTRRPFESLTPIYPQPRIKLETAPHDISMRLMDLITPIGKGQRGLIVAPPKAGKTILLKQIANSITTNAPECILIVLLIDERPEEVTDIERSVKGQVLASTFDQQPENHMRLSELVLERAKRLVEHGHDVVILLDSITRLARASNNTVTPSGRTLSGGLDPSALYKPKRFFGAARRVEHGGSLTIIATALIDTGSRMDDMIFEEFKGTGNMELDLERSLAERRLFPAVDVKKSSTRHEELLFTRDELKSVWQMRRLLNALDTAEATELLVDRLRHTNTNADFLQIVEKDFRRSNL